MNVWWVWLATSILSVVQLHCQGLVVIDDFDPGQCNITNHGTQVLVKNRENNEQVLICSKNDGLYQWQTPGGDNPIGEIFNPGYDCSKILDSYPEAKDGMYWINFGGYYPKHVYCDMTTDGGGYILVGRKNTSKTWTVPSNDFPVKPYGDPHWSSNLGDAPILDFRVQIATEEDFHHTKADWSFRLKSERLFKKLMVDGQGCSPDEPGIGNIAYVKDLQTKTIVSTRYRCSVFGKYQHSSTGFGWHQMNSCLNKPCKNGYAYWDHPAGIALQVDFHGSFSFSASGNYSGVIHDATAFIGCSPNQKCCGCFGPAGGTGDYCSPDCAAKNGGTVNNNTYTWFWVRTSLPKRVWNRCMQYKVKSEAGKMVSYRLLDGNTTPEKGRCPKDDVLLNEGIVVVPDGETAKKVPAVPGLLEYRKDNKELYVRANETWKVIAPEKKILEKTSEMVIPKLKDIKLKLFNQNQTIRKEASAVDSKLKQVDQKLHVQNQTIDRNNLEIHSELKDVKEMLNMQNQTMNKKIRYLERKVIGLFNMTLIQAPQECRSYTLLDNQDRNADHTGGSVKCDSSTLVGWHRFGGAAGTQLPTSCVPRTDTSIVKCNTHAVSWLKGAHPEFYEGKVTRQVCFSYNGRCCYWPPKNIEVINCGNFYVYNFVSTPSCSARYCGTDV